MKKFNTISNWLKLLSTVIVLISIIVIIGWIFNKPVLKSFSQQWISMKLNAAICTLLFGILIFVYQKWLKLALALSLLIALLGLLVMVEYIFMTDLGFDQLLLKDSDTTFGVFISGRIYFAASINFLLSGIAFFLIIRPNTSQPGSLPAGIAKALMVVVLFITLFSFSGYIFLQNKNYDLFLARYLIMPLPTAMLFFLITISFFLIRYNFMLSLNPSVNPHGPVLIKLVALPMYFALLAATFFIIYGTSAGWFSDIFGDIFLFSFLSVFLFLTLYLASNIINKAEIKRLLAEEKISVFEKKLISISENSKDLIYYYRLLPTKGFVYISPSSLAITGFSPEEHYTNPKLDFRLGFPHNKKLKNSQPASQNDLNKTVRLQWQKKDGTIIWIEQQNTFIYNDKGEVLAISGIGRDITHTVEKEEEAAREIAIRVEAEESLKIVLDNFEQSKLSTLNILEDLKEEIEERTKAEQKALRLNEQLEKRVLERTAALDKSNTALMENKAALVKYLTDLKEKSIVLEKTASQLKETNAELESFSYSVSHDLRAPLRAINGFSQILAEDYETQLDAEGKQTLRFIGNNVKKMSCLIYDLLSFSRIGRKEVNAGCVNMTSLVESVIEEQKQNNTKKNIEFVIKKLPVVKADASLLAVVFTNLISNAIKFSNKNEKIIIEIESDEKDDKIIYSVKDNGVGFNMKYAHKLFGVFQRLHSEFEFEGTGVGLALVQRIITRHGGKVWAQSQPGKGAAFYFSLPK